VPKHAHGTANLDGYSESQQEFMEKAGALFDRIVNPDLTVRRIYITANHVKYYYEKKPLHQLSIFTDYEKKMDDDARASRREQAILEIKGRYGKNAILRGLNFEEGATQRDRNAQVGGHKE
jgi:DNA polymerase V